MDFKIVGLGNIITGTEKGRQSRMFLVRDAAGGTEMFLQHKYGAISHVSDYKSGMAKDPISMHKALLEA